jgi:hypothetical protein
MKFLQTATVLEDSQIDWDIKTYSFMEVIQGLKEGKNFKRKEWDKNRILWGDSYGEYPIGLHNSGMIDFCDGSKSYALTIQDIEATDWIEMK